jgi:prophage regulatory protein
MRFSNIKHRKKMLKLKEVQKITGLSRSSIYSYIEKGVFPIQVKLGQLSVAWIDQEITEWLESRISARDAANSSTY